MQEKGSREKRQFVRFIISIPLKLVKMGKGCHSPASTNDISAKGIGLIAIEELAVNATVDIVLEMPDNGEKIPVQAEVVWLKKIGPDKFRAGLMLKDSQIKPIPLVLRTLNARF